MTYSTGVLKGVSAGDSLSQEKRESYVTHPSKLHQNRTEAELRRRGLDIRWETHALAGDPSAAPMTDLTASVASGTAAPLTLTVRSTAGMDKGTITVLIDQEIFTCTVTDATHLAASARAVSSTVAQAHAVGATVRMLTGLNPATNVAASTIRGADTRICEVPVMGTPDWAEIFLGVNDGNWNFNSVYQANLQALIKALKYGAYGVSNFPDPPIIGGATISNAFRSCRVAVPAGLPAGARRGDRVVVMRDANANGGQDVSSTGDAPRINTDLSGSPEQTVWECDNPRPGVLGWRRVARASTLPFDGLSGRPSGGCSRIVVISTHYRNYSSTNPARDTTSAPTTYDTGLGGTVGLNSDINAKAAAAVTAEDFTLNGRRGVVLVDLYNFMRQRVLDGKDPDFSGGTTYDQSVAGTVADGNTHFDDYGQWRIYQAKFDTTYGIPAATLSKWIDELGG